MLLSRSRTQGPKGTVLSAADWRDLEDSKYDFLLHISLRGTDDSKGPQILPEEVIRDRSCFRKTYNEWAPVVFTILVLEENVHDSSGQRVEKSEDSHGDEELRGGRGVANQCQLLPFLSLTGGHFKGHLVQPETTRGKKTWHGCRRWKQHSLSRLLTSG